MLVSFHALPPLSIPDLLARHSRTRLPLVGVGGLDDLPLNSGGDVSLSWGRPDGGDYKLLSHKFDSKKRDLYRRTEWLPLPSYLANRNFPGTIFYSLSIPHWLLLLCYAFLWIVLILFQWLIVKRIKARQTALGEEGSLVVQG